MQLSLLSADMAEPALADVGGLLAAHGQVAAGPSGARLSVLVAERWRADALLAECALRGLAAEVVSADDDWLLRTERSPGLSGVAAAWTKGAVKAVPPDLSASAGLLRSWLITAGRPGVTGFLLGLDPHAPDTHQPLAAALARAGLTGAVIGAASSVPAIRLTGRRRIRRLLEMVGGPPAAAPDEAWPHADSPS